MDRQQNINRLQAEIFDLCIIGGGATGAGCALDAAMRGLKVLLIEQEDFAAATSSKSTKLIHGGVRYLELAFKKLSLGHLKMVRKALRERKILLEIAPHFSRPLAILTPCFSLLERLYYTTGLKIYDLLSGSGNLAPSNVLSKKLTLKRLPALRQEHLSGAVLYRDGQFNDLRYCIALVLTAARFGATPINHFKVTGFDKDAMGKLVACQASDTLSGKTYTIRSKLFLNAAGPFADRIRMMVNPNLSARLRLSRGVHITLPKSIMPGDTALLIPETDDGRLIFVIPYRDVLLVGTTDSDSSSPEHERLVSKVEINYLLQHVNRYLQTVVQPEQVLASFSGLRPLLKLNSGNQARELVRDHAIELDANSGLLSALGGKWTTYRLMAEAAINVAEQQLYSKISQCDTAGQILEGGAGYDHDELYQHLLDHYRCPADIAEHLLLNYASNACTIAGMRYKENPLWKRLVEGAPFTECEIDYLIKNEMACTVRDIVARRWGLTLIHRQRALALVRPTGQYMSAVLNWSDVERHIYIEQFAEELEGPT